jgi:hypothetical protein
MMVTLRMLIGIVSMWTGARVDQDQILAEMELI